MALINRKPKKKEVDQAKLAYDQSNEIKKMSLFVTIVDHGQSEAVLKICQDIGCSLQFVQMGQGTAQKQILEILGVSDNKKDVVLSIIKKENIPEIKREIEAFFAVNKRNRGIGFSIPLTSVAGIKAYQFLSDCL